jgi:cytosolic 5'-nucleotidase 3
MENIIISNQEELEKKLEGIKKGGVDNLHFLSDFDRTLTYGMVDGEKTPSAIAVLREDGYLDKDYSQRAKALFEHYHPYEVDFNLSLQEKKKKMKEWWDTHFNILIEKGLNKKDLEKVIESRKIKLREGIGVFLEEINQQKIPFVVFSASGCGEIVEMFFEKKQLNFPNIHFLINRFNWDEEGRAVSIREPVIHVSNKDETAIQEAEDIYKEVENRKNVILLGDSLSDTGMVEGFDYDNLLKIGFLNSYNESQLEEYKKEYDIIILNDSNFTPLYKNFLKPLI